MTIGLRAAIQSLLILVAFGVLAFVPAGTFDYWQAWLFLAVFTIATLVSLLRLSDGQGSGGPGAAHARRACGRDSTRCRRSSPPACSC